MHCVAVYGFCGFVNTNNALLSGLWAISDRCLRSCCENHSAVVVWVMSTSMHPPLSRESISRQGLAILDEYGLADVTMRRVASALGVAPGALYWHISNKQELIAGIATLIIAPLIDAPPHAAPSPAALCAKLRETLLRHRDGAEVVTTAMSQPGSTVAHELTRIMREAIARELADARREASISNVHSVADGLLYMTLGAASVHQAAEQLAEATGERAAEPATAATDVAAAISLLLTGLLDASSPPPTEP